MSDDAPGGSGGGAVEPLLKKARYHPNCPGCRVDRRKEESEGFPFTELSCMWLVTICSSLPLHSLSPFLYFMIRDLHIAKEEEDIGFYAGFVGASYMFGRALSSVIWGVVADKYGRKPVLVITLFSVIIFNTLFGLSASYWMALATRGLLGLFSGILGPIKAYATEVSGKEQSHLALSLISSSRGIGLIVGPAIAGYLAQPADKYPGIFSQNSIFGRFPYFLPCLCISLLAIAALVACFWLPETLHKHKDMISNNSVEAAEESLSDPNAEENCDGCLCLFTHGPLISAITVYCIFSLQDMAYAEVFSLWAVSDRKYGGLSFSSQDVGSILATSGVFLLIYQILIFPSVAKSIEPIALVRTIAILTIPLLSSYSFMPALSGFFLQLVVNCASFLKNAFSVTTIIVFNILMNDAVSQDLRASVNGLSVTLMSIFKAIGPAIAGVIFSWAQRRQTALFLPGDGWVAGGAVLVGDGIANDTQAFVDAWTAACATGDTTYLNVPTGKSYPIWPLTLSGRCRNDINFECDHLVFFMLNVVTVVGITLTLRPFFARRGTTH